MPWQKAVVVVVVAVAVETMTTNDRIPCTTRRPSVPVSLLRYFRAFSRSTDSTRVYPEPIPFLINILLSNELVFLKTWRCQTYQRCLPTSRDLQTTVCFYNWNTLRCYVNVVTNVKT